MLFYLTSSRFHHRFNVVIQILKNPEKKVPSDNLRNFVENRPWQGDIELKLTNNIEQYRWIFSLREVEFLHQQPHRQSINYGSIMVIFSMWK